MFDVIAPTYDLLNRALSFGIDTFWRKRLMRTLGPLEGRRTLDVACGSGDLILSCRDAGAALTVGADVSVGMLHQARNRLRSANPNHALVAAAAEVLPFRDGAFDVVTVAFGLRNFEEPLTGLREMLRVLSPGGQFRILEFSEPSPGVWGSLFRWYFRAVLPRIGALVSGHSEAYQYLYDSVQAFPSGRALVALVEKAGFTHATFDPLSGGIAILYSAAKMADSGLRST